MTPTDGRLYVVVVSGKLRPECVEDYKHLLQPLVEKARHEQNCLTYQLCTGTEDDPGAFCLFERYVSRELFETEVWYSPQLKDFMEKTSAANMYESRTVSFYWQESKHGFIVK